ncbi:hypothetical protein ACH5RR_037431 [Cinchona calisaya]|uniref:Cytochrome P450 n=1 Tax=Cinchona calisaya TaxID=153742 RepID=A0ABD2YAU9_9GENT
MELNDDNYLLFPILLSPSILIFIFVWYKASKGLKLPPGPPAWPIIGNTLDLDAQKPHTWLANLAKCYGPLISLRLGPKFLVVASSPATAREILKTHDKDLSGRYKSRLSTAIPDFKSSVIVLSADCNERWRFLRSNAHLELFSARAIESHSKIRAEKAEEMLHFLFEKDNEVVAIADILYATIVNSLTNTMLSEDIIGLEENVDDLRKFSRSLIEFAVPGMADIFSVMEVFDSGTKRKAKEYKEKSRAVWGNIVRDRRGRQKDFDATRMDFLDVLIRNSFDDCQIFNVFSELFVTSDSISTTLEWAVAELTRNQEAFTKLRDEITKSIEEGTTITENHLTKLPYFQACIKETLRLHPPSPFLVPHCALQSCKVMNYEVPKNSLVVVNIYAIGRDPNTWEDPLSFKPERFLGKNIDLKGTHYELLPFGGGRRICIGIPLALKQIQLLLASLVYAFDWSLPDGMDPTKLDMSDKFSIPLGRAKPLLLILKKRKHLKIHIPPPRPKI